MPMNGPPVIPQELAPVGSQHRNDAQRVTNEAISAECTQLEPWVPQSKIEDWSRLFKTLICFLLVLTYSSASGDSVHGGRQGLPTMFFPSLV